MSSVIARCPKCSSARLSRNEDGDLECSCGYIVYKHKATTLPPSKIADAQWESKMVPDASSVPTLLEDYNPGATRAQFFDALHKVSVPLKKKLVVTPPAPLAVAKTIPIAEMPPLSTDARPSSQLTSALCTLSADAVKAFRKDFEVRCTRYGERPEVSADAYYETLTDRTDMRSVQKELLYWSRCLRDLPDCAHTRGAILVLSVLVELCAKLDKMTPPEQ